MDIKLINIGFSSIIAARRIKMIADPELVSIKRIIADARERGELINATHGRRTRSVIIIDSGHVVLSALHLETMEKRYRAES
jgi:extracellular matrix regulatory protein A